MNKKLIFLIFSLFIITVILSLLALGPNRKAETTPPFVSPTPVQLLPNPQSNHSKISILIPGKTSESDVIRVLGQPYSQNTSDSESQLFYLTQENNFYDTVSLKQGLVFYTVENVFSDSTYGTTQVFTSRSGPYFTKFYNAAGDYYWDVYLSLGLGVETNGNQILKLVRFAPQNKSSFLSSVGQSLSLTENQTVPHEGI